MTDREIMQQALEALEGIQWPGSPSFVKAAITALRERLAQPEQERWVWRNAAIRVGEELSSVGPVGYYDMTAAQWLDWAMAQEPRGKNSLAQPEQESFSPEAISATQAAWKMGYDAAKAEQPEQEPIKESSVTHSHLWIGDLYGKEKNT